MTFTLDELTTFGQLVVGDRFFPMVETWIKGVFIQSNYECRKVTTDRAASLLYMEFPAQDSIVLFLGKE